MRLISFLTALFVFFYLFTSKTIAVYEPASVPNNRFGIHIIDPVDLEDASALVNSSSGDWGYVTLVITQTQRDTKRWQEVFDRARRLHLIPILRVATKPLGDIWEKPSLGDIDGWVSFFNSLNWTTKNRYVIIGNEPNHAKEWGGEINPEEYGVYLDEFAAKLKGASADYYVLPAGFDASAGNSKETLDEVAFLRRLLAAKPELFTHIDGWASHSYPNPAFSGPENGFGRGSVRTYDWELSVLKGLGVSKELPVFITETGWAHNGNTDKVGQKFSFAYQKAWNDKRVVAVTPFVLSYSEPLFETFSWRSKDGNFYGFYSEVQSLTKTRGEPLQDDRGKIMAVFVSPVHTIDSVFSGIVLVKNEGQAIWSKEELSLTLDGVPAIKTESSFALMEPNSVGLMTFSAQAPQESGLRLKSVSLTRLGKPVTDSSYFQLFTISPIRMKTESFFGTILRFVTGL